MTTGLLRRLFTVKEYNRMVEAGILTEDDRVELIRGEIVQMSPIGRRHAAHVRRLDTLLSEKLGRRALVDTQNPIELDDASQPQPDVALLQTRADFYESGHPQAEDILLIVEVADTTVETDRDVKIPLYAQQGISEVWLVDINGQCLEVYRQPSAEGYQERQKFYRGQTLFIQAFPDVEIAVADVLG